MAAGQAATRRGRRAPGLRRLIRRALASAALACGFAAAAAEAVTFDDLRPILEERCVMCHSGAAAPAGLDLSSLAGLMAGSVRGPVVMPLDPEASELVRRLRGESLPRMPLTGPPYLSDEEIARFVRWIQDGAPAGGDAGADGGAAGGAAEASGAAEAIGAADGAPAEPPAVATTPPPGDPGPVTYADVQPLLLARCATCHTAAGLLGPPPEGYRLDSYDEALRSSDRVRIVPGNPAASELVRRAVGQAEPRMPLGGPYLDDAEIDLLVRWITGGARDASGTPAALPPGTEVRLHGTWRGQGRLDDLDLVVDGATRFDDDVRPGDRVQVRGVLGADGRIRAERVRLE